MRSTTADQAHALPSPQGRLLMAAPATSAADQHPCFRCGRTVASAKRLHCLNCRVTLALLV